MSADDLARVRLERELLDRQAHLDTSPEQVHVFFDGVEAPGGHAGYGAPPGAHRLEIRDELGVLRFGGPLHLRVGEHYRPGLRIVVEPVGDDGYTVHVAAEVALAAQSHAAGDPSYVARLGPALEDGHLVFHAQCATRHAGRTMQVSCPSVPGWVLREPISPGGVVRFDAASPLSRDELPTLRVEIMDTPT